MPSPPNILFLLQTMQPEECAQAIQHMSHGFDSLVGLNYTHASASCVRAVLVVNKTHLQPYGLTHGGLYCTIGESICSVGANLETIPNQNLAVGHRNTTTFHRGSRLNSHLIAEATPHHIEQKNRLLWVFTIKDENGTLCADGEVLLAVHEQDTDIAGEPLSFSEII